MSYFIHRERYLSTPVPSQGIVSFPTLVKSSSSPAAFRKLPPYDSMTNLEWENALSSLVPKNDISYHGCSGDNCLSSEGPWEGAIDILLPGIYLLSWFVSQMTGHSETGSFFQLKVYDYDQEVWRPFGESGQRLLVSASHAHCVFSVSQSEILTHQKVTLAIFNVSNEPLLMNRTPNLKAGLSIYGFEAVDDEMLQAIEDKIQEFMEQSCCDEDCAAQLSCLKKQLHYLLDIEADQNYLIKQLNKDWEDFFQIFLYHTSSAPRIPIVMDFPSSLNLYYNRIGYLYNFWLENNIGSSQVVLPRVNNKSMLATPSLTPIPPYDIPNMPALLTFARPVPSVGNCYAPNVTGSQNSWLPVYFDQTGIYFLSTANLTIPANTTLNFLHTLILDFID